MASCGLFKYTTETSDGSDKVGPIDATYSAAMISTADRPQGRR